MESEHQSAVVELIAFFEIGTGTKLDNVTKLACVNRFLARRTVWGDLNLAQLRKERQHSALRNNAARNLINGDNIDALNLMMLAFYVGAQR